MTKKKRKDKELARLRREVEVLRAQMAGREPQRKQPFDSAGYQPVPGSAQGPAEGGRSQKERPPSIQTPTRTVKQTPLRVVDPKYIKKDLLKSGLLTVIACAIVGGLYVFRARIPFF